MRLASEFKENKTFERTLRDTYSKEVCDIVIEWIEEALAYTFKEISDSNIFVLGKINRNDKTIEYSDK